jgi:hypothetical protein
MKEKYKNDVQERDWFSYEKGGEFLKNIGGTEKGDNRFHMLDSRGDVQNNKGFKMHTDIHTLS